MRVKRPEVSKQILFSLLVIALSTVIAVQCGSVAPNAAVPDPVSIGIKETVKEPEKQPVVDAIEPRKEPEVKSASVESKDESKSAIESVEKSDSKVDSEANKRKARADSAPVEAPKSSEAKVSEKAAQSAPKSDPKAATKASQSAKQQLQQQQLQRQQQEQASKSGSKSKLPPNLGTVTSTGSGGHYLSKHDAYSAIAEKHGALAQDAMKKSDKRQLQSFGGIQKASGGFGDVLSPFKGVTDSGLARTLGASMRSIMKSKYSVPAYVASALLGAVALMAFYESPISPLPVPPLPEPPVGRFPPEMPNLPVGTQVPFRGNQQQYGQNYNQRSLNQPQQLGYLNQQAQQVLFPGQNAQQRQMNLAGPVQLAASLLNKQIAQRKSSPDYDLSSSRSFFGGSNQLQKLSSAAPAQQKQGSFLSYFGLGNNAAPQAASASVDQGSMQQPLMSAVNPANTLIAAASAIESKGQSSGLSNSHLVNKVKSYFSRSGPTSTGSASSSANVANSNSNLFDQYQKMSLIQALMKDTAFIPGFLSSNRKSSPAAPHSQSSAGSKIQSVANALSPGNGPAARMQVGSDGQLSSGQLISMPANKAAQSKTSGHGGLARIAHALLETFSSGISQRSLSPSNNQDARKSVGQSDDATSSLASATSLLSDIMSSYSAAQEQAPQQSQEQAKSSAPSQSQQQQQATNGNQQQQQSAHQQDSQATGRSVEATAAANSDDTQHSTQQQASSSPNKQQVSVSSASSETHVRKTRSISSESNDNNQERRDWHPSKAAQINNVIDFVSDSYSQNRLLFNFFMNQVGLSQAVPYMEQMLVSSEHH